MNNRLFFTPLALAGALLGASSGAFAQSQQGPAPQNDVPPGQYQQGYPQNGQPGPNGQFGQNGMHAHRPGPIKMALKSLALSQDQRAQVRNVMRAFRESKQSQTPMTRQQMIAQLRGILTPDQQARFQGAMRAARAQQRMNGQQGQFGPQGQGGPQGPYGPQGQGGPQGPGQQDPGGPNQGYQQPN